MDRDLYRILDSFCQGWKILWVGSGFVACCLYSEDAVFTVKFPLSANTGECKVNILISCLKSLMIILMDFFLSSITSFAGENSSQQFCCINCLKVTVL